MSGWLKDLSGKFVIRRAIALWTRWMDVDSSGSRNPEASPRAMTFLFQGVLRMPARNRRKFGSEIGSPSRPAFRLASASSSFMYSLQYTWPLPVRDCNGMRHCQPADLAVDRVYGIGSPTFRQ